MLKKILVRSGISSPVLLLMFPVVTAGKGEYRIALKEKKLHHHHHADTLAQPVPAGATGYLPADSAGELTAPTIALSKHVSKFVKTYMVREEEALEKVKGRSPSYFKMIEEVFAKYDLPAELKYLAVVESDLKTKAVSKAGAKGLWQFMPETAKDLGLKITARYDERTYAYKSTVAAAKYLRDLHRQFGDWLLVIAAYNSGPGPVYAAIKKAGSRNFWGLQSYLPPESRGHVKRFIGTHYYFEGKGSLVTLTKAETTRYFKEMEAFRLASQIAEPKTDSLPAIAVVQ